jgi:hypothetical protein
MLLFEDTGKIIHFATHEEPTSGQSKADDLDNWNGMITYTIPLAQLKHSKLYPLTRKAVVDFASSLSEDMANDVRIVVTTDDQDDELGLAFELATVELGCSLEGEWVLQYVSHPAQSSHLTEAVAPVAKDFESYVRLSQSIGWTQTIEPVCADDLEKEGLGPLAVLDLRPENPVPLVPLRADITFLQVPSGATHST